MPVRWLIAGLLAALSGLLGWVLKSMSRRIESETDRVERQAHERIARETERIERQLHERIDSEMRHMHSKLDQIYGHVLTISENTAKRHQDRRPPPDE